MARATVSLPTPVSPERETIIDDCAAFFKSGTRLATAELDPKTSLLIELHLVTSPSGSGAAGPGGLTLVLTEALATWQLYENYLYLCNRFH